MSKFSKSILSVTAAVAIVAATLSPVIVTAWGDSSNGRKSYTLEQINKGELGDKITFNSISNSKIGDEKNFVGAKVSGANVETWNANTIDVHNNSPKGDKAVAKGVKATFSIPTTVAKSQTIIGYLDSSNATPNRYWDEVTLNASENVYLEYVKGSAKFNNNKGTFAIPDAVISSSGASLGYTSMNGEIPGCFEYSGVLTIDVKVHKSVAAKISKQVRIKGTKGWNEMVDAKVGDELEYQIEYVNLLAEEVKDVMIRDVLPTNVEYVKDSTYLYNGNYPSGTRLKDNTVTTSGINIGGYKAQSNAFVRFTGKVVDKTMDCGKNQLVNWASVTVSASSVKDAVYKDDASVVVNKDDESCHEKPEDPTPEDPTPEDPTPEDPTPEEPKTEEPAPTPTVIVSTGPEAVVTGAIGAGSVVTTLGYYIASRKKLQ